MVWFLNMIILPKKGTFNLAVAFVINRLDKNALVGIGAGVPVGAGL